MKAFIRSTIFLLIPFLTLSLVSCTSSETGSEEGGDSSMNDETPPTATKTHSEDFSELVILNMSVAIEGDWIKIVEVNEVPISGENFYRNNPDLGLSNDDIMISWVGVTYYTDGGHPDAIEDIPDISGFNETRPFISMTSVVRPKEEANSYVVIKEPLQTAIAGSFANRYGVEYRPIAQGVFTFTTMEGEVKDALEATGLIEPFKFNDENLENIDTADGYGGIMRNASHGNAQTYLIDLFKQEGDTIWLRNFEISGMKDGKEIDTIRFEYN